MEKNISSRLQKKIVTYSALGILFIGLLLASISLFPLYGYLKTDQEKDLLFAVKTRGMAVEEYFSRCTDIAVQIGNRTAIRQRLESYYRESRDLQGLKAFAQKVLTDSLHGSENLAGITLLDSGWRPLGEVGLSIPQKFWPVLSGNSASIVTRSG